MLTPQTEGFAIIVYCGMILAAARASSRSAVGTASRYNGNYA